MDTKNKKIKKRVVVKRKMVVKTVKPIITFTNNNNLLCIPTKFFIAKDKSGKKKKTPCFIKKIKTPSGYVFSPNLGVPFYKWDKEMIKQHTAFLKQYGKLSDCDGVIVLLYNTKFVMIDTDDEEAEMYVRGLSIFADCPMTHSLTKTFGRHRYIKLEDTGNYTAETKIDNKEIDIITEYVFEGISQKAENMPNVCEVSIDEFNETLNIQLKEKDISAIENIQKKHNNKKQATYKIKDKIRNQFLAEDEIVNSDILTELVGGLDPNAFGSYKHWFRLLCGIHNQALNVEQDIEYMGLFIDFMNKADNAKAEWYKENIATWKGLKDTQNPDYMVKSGSLFKYLQEQNEPLFIKLKMKRRQQIDPPSFNKIKSYPKQKEEFEKSAFIIKSEKPTFCEMDWVEGELKERSVENFKQCHNTLRTEFKSKDKKGKERTDIVSFIDLWINDPHRKEYDRMNFIPPPKPCNPYTYNLYNGMFVDDLADDTFESMTAEERIERLDKILQHLYFLAGCENECYEFLLKVFAYKIKFPGILHKISCVFRSVQGCGKNAFLDWFGDKILGSTYYCCSANADDFVGKFGALTKGKLLVCFNEMDGNAGYKHSARLKEYATEETITHEKKNVDRKKIKNCMLICYATNKSTPVCIEIGDRRFFVVECSDRVLYMPNYFEELFDDLDDGIVAMCFAWYCRNIVEVEEDFNFKKERPITRTYKEMRNKNKGIFVKFIEWIMAEDLMCLEDMKFTNNQLWEKFLEFMEYTRSKGRLDKSGFDNILSEYIYSCSDEMLRSRDWKKVIRKKKNSVYVFKFNVVRCKALVDMYDNDADIHFSDDDSECEETEPDF